MILLAICLPTLKVPPFLFSLFFPLFVSFLPLSLPDYYQEPPPPSKHTYPLPNKNGEKEGEEKKIEVNLVGDHPLWAHHLWNAG